MRVVFMGTPQLAATVLEALHAHHDIAGVFTRPDAVRGRGKKLVPSPVKETAGRLGLPVHTPATLRDDAAAELVESLEPDIICVAAYGCLLPKRILDIPPLGCLNVHTSLLPRWRGAAPIERAILAGDAETGVCIMRMEEGLDTGPYCARETVPVEGRTLAEMTGTLGSIGADALVGALDELQAGRATWHDQGSDGLVYAEKIGKGELGFSPDEDVRTIDAKVRVSNDSHPSKIRIAGKTVSVERARVIGEGDVPQPVELNPGEATFAAKRLIIGAADGLVELERVKPDGKKSMEGKAFAAGLQGIRNETATWESA